MGSGGVKLKFVNLTYLAFICVSLLIVSCAPEITTPQTSSNPSGDFCLNEAYKYIDKLNKKFIEKGVNQNVRLGEYEEYTPFEDKNPITRDPSISPQKRVKSHALEEVHLSEDNWQDDSLSLSAQGIRKWDTKTEEIKNIYVISFEYRNTTTGYGYNEAFTCINDKILPSIKSKLDNFINN